MYIVLPKNEQISIVLPDKGAEIMTFLHKPTAGDSIWYSPNILPNLASNNAAAGGNAFPRHGWASQLDIELWSIYPCAGLQKAIASGPAKTLQPGKSFFTSPLATTFEAGAEPIYISRRR